jgi:cobalt-zinc-cadmium efflux system membrane fusion protein
VAQGREAIAIPKVALLSDEGNDFVFKHLKDDYYVRRPVKKGREFDDSVEVVDGLKVGETIISDGSFLLKSDVLRSKMGAGCAD